MSTEHKILTVREDQIEGAAAALDALAAEGWGLVAVAPSLRPVMVDGQAAAIRVLHHYMSRAAGRLN